jgi:hypothetical protein
MPRAQITKGMAEASPKRKRGAQDCQVPRGGSAGVPSHENQPTDIAVPAARGPRGGGRTATPPRHQITAINLAESDSTVTSRQTTRSNRTEDGSRGSIDDETAEPNRFLTLRGDF